MLDVKTLLINNMTKAVIKLYNLTLERVLIEHPENTTFGDFATNTAMLLAKQVHKAPMVIAQELVYELLSYEDTFELDGQKYPLFTSIVSVAPGFINFTLSPTWLKNTLVEIITLNETFGASKMGNKKRIIVEFSQPNPNKPMHIGHSRNNFLGSAISNIFSFLDYDVIRTNYMNDWGTHICKSMLMYKKYGNSAMPTIKSDHFVGSFYKMYETEVEKTPELAGELAEMFQKLEAGDLETLSLWKQIVEWAYTGWQTTYANENVTFDVWLYQNNYTQAGKEIVQLALERGLAEKDSTGAVIARLESYGIPDKVLLRSDGTSIYVTQDTQLAKDSYEKYHFDKRIYVVDIRQSDYFKQLFKILALLGFDWATKLYHLAYGVVGLPEGKMSSRKGIVVNADDVFDTLVNLEEAEMRQSLKSVEELKASAKKVALAAYRYELLRVDPKQDVTFNYEQVTKFEGNTGPYLLYTYARALSIMEKSGYGLDFVPEVPMTLADMTYNPQELALMRVVYKLPETVLSSAEHFAPNELANYMFEVAQMFNSFYASSPILSCEGNVKAFRLSLVLSSAHVLKNGLRLLGINVVEHM